MPRTRHSPPARPRPNDEPTFEERPSEAPGKGMICLAVYNPNRELFERQLLSISRQTITDWECLVGIDGPDPEVAEFIDQIVCGDRRFQVVQFGENVGHYRNFERLTNALASDVAWFALADQDDDWWPNKLELLLAEMSSTDANVVCGQARVVTDSGRQIGRTHRRNSTTFGLLMNNQITGSTSVFKRSVLDLALPFPTPTDGAYHDHWLGVCAKALGRAHVVSAIVQDYVQHPNNVVGEERRWILRARIRRIRMDGNRLSDSVRYISKNRWGWRVEMARCLVMRLGGALDPRVREVAEGRLTRSLASALASATLRHEVPAERALGLLVGAYAWPRLLHGSQVSGA